MHLLHIALQFTLAIIEANPEVYLDEIQDELFLQHDIDVSLATISRLLKSLGITSKKVRIYTSLGLH